jgi:prepilin peptidase dependent protein B
MQMHTISHTHTQSRSMRRASTQGGMSLIELLISVTISLFIVLTGTSLLTTHLREDRGLLLEARLMQDLRTAGDVVARDLRRSGYWAGAADAPGGSTANPYTSLLQSSTPSATAPDAITFQYSRDDVENNAVDANEQFGFRLHNAAIDVQLGNGNWQSLTDAQALRITAFSVTPSVQDIALLSFCAHACAPGKNGIALDNCPPHQQVRSLDVVIEGTLAADARVTRTLRSTVRLRNDVVIGSCAV